MDVPYKLTLEERIAVFTLNDDLLHTKDNAVEYYKIVWGEIAREYKLAHLSNDVQGMIIKTSNRRIAKDFSGARVDFIADAFGTYLDPLAYVFAFGGLIAGLAIGSYAVVSYNLKTDGPLCLLPLAGLILGAFLGHRLSVAYKKSNQSNPLVAAIREAQVILLT